MASIAKNDPWWLADPHGAGYTKQGLLGPTVPNFWVFNPAYASVENTHVWPMARADGRHALDALIGLRAWSQSLRARAAPNVRG